MKLRNPLFLKVQLHCSKYPAIKIRKVLFLKVQLHWVTKGGEEALPSYPFGGRSEAALRRNPFGVKGGKG
jgi:hypothetical protein